jgi:hypothetical protein
MHVTVHAQLFGRVACLVVVENAVATVYLLSGTLRQQIVDEDGEPVRFRHARGGTPDALSVALTAFERTFGTPGWRIPIEGLPPLGTPVYVPLRTGRRLKYRGWADVPDEPDQD